ncbi:hypothetical protein DERP_012566 [Dermatophagoides pteronyssinus]|uniref:Uncharacterized protein n=1 Tax=Dermatophagoides pteronyssinus TaxID=6956 RepID=A0ABQ8IV48_DERPT|nr:hypothetical protein DERP_012566 [Dermatophagoides pteronyssinus]
MAFDCCNGGGLTLAFFNIDFNGLRFLVLHCSAVGCDNDEDGDDCGDHDCSILCIIVAEPLLN